MKVSKILQKYFETGQSSFHFIAVLSVIGRKFNPQRFSPKDRPAERINQIAGMERRKLRQRSRRNKRTNSRTCDPKQVKTPSFR